MSLLSQVLKVRRDLRLVLTSATLDARHLRTFYDLTHAQPQANEHVPLAEPAMLTVEGRQHDVSIHYLKAPTSDYVNATVEAVLRLHEVRTDCWSWVWGTGLGVVGFRVKEFVVLESWASFRV